MQLFSLAAPLLICAVFAAAYVRRVDILSVFAEGALDGLKNAWSLFPTLLFVLLIVSFAYNCGALDVLTGLFAPALERLGFPPEVLPLAAVRPLSGSAALAVFENILGDISPDSEPGRIAAVLLGSTETTFYTIAVYYSAVRRKPDKRVFITSLTADFAALVFSSFIVRVFY